MASNSVRIVLIGKNEKDNCGVGNTILGTTAFDSEVHSSYLQQHSVKISGTVDERNISVINTFHLLHPHLSLHQITQRVRECVSLSAPGPDVILLVLQFNDFSDEDMRRVKTVLNLFSEKAIEHTIVVTTDEETYTSMFTFKIWGNPINTLIKECGGRHLKFDTRNTGWRSEMLRKTEKMLKEEDEEFVILNMDEDLSRSGGSVQGEDKEEENSDLNEDGKLNKNKKTRSDGGVPERVKLNLVVCGSDRRLKSLISNLILKQKEASELSSECVRRDVELHGRLISVLELPALFNTQLSEEEVMRQTLRCVSLCDPGVHLFLLIIPDAPINNEDRAEIDKIQKIFSSRINKHIMILIKQNSEERTAELNEETQSVIESFGGRHHFIGPKTQASMLMEKLKQVVEENNDVCFSKETLLEDSKGSRERADDLRIVLLGKTGVGKSSTGNTILGRDAFAAESGYASITKECKSESAEINGQRITVIDTPGLSDTEHTNEEIQREISNCISMILPGPHVFLLLIPVGRFTQEEATAVKIIQETLGENSLKFTIVLFTRGDDLKKKTIEQWLGNHEPALKNLIEACGNRYHVFNNNQTGDRTQVSDLLKKIDDMVKENGDSYYSCKMFREMERDIQEQQKMMLMENMEQRNKHEEEKKRMMMEKERKEFREREGQYKRDIKDIEDQKRKIREEMKREREEWETQKEEQRRKKEETHNTDKYNQDDEDSPSNPEHLRILLFGRTGNGKSATGNTILGNNEPVKCLVTTRCKKGVGEVKGKSVAVVDTPGFFETKLTKEQVKEQMMNCVALSAPGPHVFIIVLRLRRITKEDRDTLDTIKMIFGPKAADFSIVLFTRADELRRQTIEQYVETSRNDELKKLISDCGNRFLAFNNRETQDRAQVTQLFNMIEDLNESNEGRFFIHEMFEEAAISIEQRRKTIEENERKNQAEVEELEDKYEMEIRHMIMRLDEKKGKAEEERVKLENKFREKEETLRREFEEKEKSEQKKQEKEENNKRLEEEKHRRTEYVQRIDEMEREIEKQRLQYEKQQQEREDRKRDEEYKQDQEGEINRREREKKNIIEREEKEYDEMKQKFKEEIKKMKKKHQDESRKQEEELNKFIRRKEQHVQEFKERLDQLYEQKKKQEKRCLVM